MPLADTGRGDGARPWALVTGGAIRLGRVFVEAAAANGYAVAVHAHSSLDAGRALVGELRQRGHQAELVPADLIDPMAPAKLVEDLAAAGRTPSLLVNSAASFAHDRLSTASADRFDAHMALNLRAPLLLSRAFAAACPTSAGGLIVNVVDQRALQPSGEFLTYTLAKSALLQLTRILAMELAPAIRVNALAPGIVMPERAMTDVRRQALVGRFPLGSGGDVDDLVAGFAYLLRARSVTGEVICVDGGAHLGRRDRP
ncbi:MAG: SDR family oxidoreductase [Pseudomonadota bacterium]